MSIFIQYDEQNNVTFYHTKPFDSEEGMGKTRQELETEGLILDMYDMPASDNTNGKLSILKINPSTNELYYEYIDRPLTSEERIKQLESELVLAREDSVSNMLAITEVYEMLLAQGGTV
ncbi:hypothetical protein [Fictibacillus sp. 18YEL24]|uniref:hypothetical protein n=1 Tax=Fictibacillus sp. 18YEL24 TaxID=2745875 RepID=UPI0018CF1B8C|nr:hypothetical protein [Fictibacillus sp. 18YEL24]MBH0171009.1 hypothetical protein [Fictibacillus sp. 18YEL24]